MEMTALRPMERRILRLVDAEIAPRLRRTPDFVERVENLARYKLSTR
jgi:hypothetical protein